MAFLAGQGTQISGNVLEGFQVFFYVLKRNIQFGRFSNECGSMEISRVSFRALLILMVLGLTALMCSSDDEYENL